ncbi:hypothetical protein FHG87_023153 [Trinorchestia longiramus]|nr:hypothetical protein FHG87_023153 [Trinorchestia longiramus]
MDPLSVLHSWLRGTEPYNDSGCGFRYDLYKREVASDSDGNSVGPRTKDVLDERIEESSQPDSAETESQLERVTITDANQIYDTLNLGRRIDVLWPSLEMLERGGRNCWGSFVPVEGMEGPVVHRWTPHHADPQFRSHVDRTIFLVRINNYYVPVAEDGVAAVGTTAL